MRKKSGFVRVLVVALAALGSLTTVHAEESREGEGAASVVAKAGTEGLTVGAVERSLRAVPDFQLATLGNTPLEIARTFVEQVMVRDMLLAEGAKAHHLEQRPEIKEQIDAALRRARIESVRKAISVSPQEIAGFYAQNLARFDTPERIGVFRILCSSEAEAKEVIAVAQGSSGLTRWKELARDKSLDKATAYRSGNLGFLAADGTSSEVSVRVDPALFSAASRVRDGEIVPEPVAEGPAFAVVWRRGSTPAVHRTLEQETAAITQVLAREKLETALRELLKTLRTERHVTQSPELVEGLEIDPLGGVAPKVRPGLAPKKPALSAAPSATPRGLR